jgi:HlyD family type I secretion membrane fusion protein
MKTLLSRFSWTEIRRFFTDDAPAPVPAFGTTASTPMTKEARARIRRPMLAGLAIILVCVVGLGLWASFAPIWSAVIAPGQVRVESNRQTLKSREGGIVRAINVREGQSVKSGDLLIQLDDTVANAQLDVLTNQYDVALMQHTRFTAEATGQRGLVVPAELRERMSDARVSATVNNETLLFTTRLQAVDGQKAILDQRLLQLETARSGLNLQVQSIDEQIRLIGEELAGYQTLYERGFAPRTLILARQRSLAELGGRRGSLLADITRNQQQAGETRLQLAQIMEQRRSEAATGLRDAEARLSDVRPRLDAARDSLAQTRITAPVDGYVLNLSQFTIGGVAQPGEPLMDVVPSGVPLIVAVQVRPSDIDEVRMGLIASVDLVGYSRQDMPKLEGEVVTVSADALTNDQGQFYFTAEIRIDPSELEKLPEGVALSPGMPVQASIRTGRRTIMAYLIGPMGTLVGQSLREN